MGISRPILSLLLSIHTCLRDILPCSALPLLCTRTEETPDFPRPTLNMADKTIYLTRHCQAEHNVAEDYSILDANLTKLGRQQAQQLNQDTVDTVQKDVELVVSSPLRRTMQTTLDGYPEAVKRLGGKGKIVLLPQAQECNDFPCDTGSPRSDLEKNPEFEDLDFSPLTDDWTSKAGPYAANVEALQARAKSVRQFLLNRPEKKIVLVAHGDILRYIVFGKQNGTPWANAEVRKYRFKADAGDDNAWLEEIKTEAKEGGDAPTSSELRN